MVYPMVTVDVNGVSHGHSWREWCIPWSQLTWMVYPMVTVDVNGVKCWALLDTGAGSSYVSSTLPDCLHLRPIRQQFKRIEIMFGTSNKAIDIYGLQIRSVDGKFILEAEVHEVDHKELSTLKNPKCTEIMAQFSYLNKLADVIKCLLGNTEVIFHEADKTGFWYISSNQPCGLGYTHTALLRRAEACLCLLIFLARRAVIKSCRLLLSRKYMFRTLNLNLWAFRIAVITKRKATILRATRSESMAHCRHRMFFVFFPNESLAIKSGMSNFICFYHQIAVWLTNWTRSRLRNV